jgi:hypothetical protein
LAWNPRVGAQDTINAVISINFIHIKSFHMPILYRPDSSVILPGITSSCLRNPPKEWLVIPPGITSSWLRNPPDEWLFRRELPAHGWGIHQMNGYFAGNYQLMAEESTRWMVISPGITSSWLRNPPDEWLPAPDWESTEGIFILPGITRYWTENS